jgi:hypothetical protein
VQLIPQQQPAVAGRHVRQHTLQAAGQLHAASAWGGARAVGAAKPGCGHACTAPRRKQHAPTGLHCRALQQRTVMLAWRRWHTPNASLTYTHARAASCAANTGSSAASPAWKRRFSSRQACVCVFEGEWGTRHTQTAARHAIAPTATGRRLGTHHRHTHLSRLQRLHRLQRAGADAVWHEPCERGAQLLLQQRCHGRQAERRTHLRVRLRRGVWPAQVAANDHARTSRQQQVERGQDAGEACGVRDTVLACQRQVEVGTVQHALAVQRARRHRINRRPRLQQPGDSRLHIQLRWWWSHGGMVM